MPDGDQAEPSTKNTPNSEMEDDESKGVRTLKTWRQVPPTHYIKKIESFSSLVRLHEKTSRDNYESNAFEASGCHWTLLLYPQGDRKRNGSDHISLYLKILNPHRAINALLIFFVYDQLKDKFLSIQDTRVRRFDTTRKEWGLSQLISLDCFRNASNGFLINDSCLFGVEVFGVKSEGKGECFRTLSEQSEKVYIWNVEKLSGLKETGHFSELFSVGDFQWKLHLYGKGIAKERGKYLSIYLCLDPPKDFPSGWKMHVEFKLSIIGQVQNNFVISKTGNAWFSALNTAWGFPRFIKLADLYSSKILIVRDAMQIGVQIISMSMAKDISPSIPKNIDGPSYYPGNMDNIPGQI